MGWFKCLVSDLKSGTCGKGTRHSLSWKETGLEPSGQSLPSSLLTPNLGPDLEGEDGRKVGAPGSSPCWTALLALSLQKSSVVSHEGRKNVK